MSWTTKEIAAAMIRALERGEGASPKYYADDATVWYNTDEVDAPAGDARRNLEILQTAVPDFRAAETHVHAWEDGCALQYVFVGTLPSGAALRIPACLIVTVRDGLVVRAQEYVDSAHAAALAEVFQPTG